MDERLKTTEDARPLIREECIVETVLEIIGRATVIEDGVERQIGPHDIHGVLYHLREACLATQRLRARQSKPAMRAIKQLGNCATQGQPVQGRRARGHSSGTRVGPHDSSPRSLRKSAAQAQARRYQEASCG